MTTDVAGWLAAISVERVLSRYLDITDRDHLHVLWWLSLQPEHVTVDQVAAAVELSSSRAEQLLTELHEDRHVHTGYEWKPVGRRLLARLTARQVELIADITSHGDRFAPLSLDARSLNTANSLVGLGYAEQRTLYTVTPATREKLGGLT